MSNARRSQPRARRAVLATSWLVMLTSAACNYYTEDLLNGSTKPDGGAGSSSSGTSSGSSGSSGSGGTKTQGGAAGTPSSTGGAGAASTSGSTAMGGADNGGADNAGAGGTPEEMTAAGAGGQAADDSCPDDPSKLEPGQCGCGIPESCTELKAALAHRYSFDEKGMVAVDSIGTAEGTIVGASANLGKVSFDGTAVAYVDLPNGLISSLKDASFELWLEWAGGDFWQRIFDFGTNDLGENNQGAGTTYLYLTPSDGSTGNVLRASFTINGLNNETAFRASAALPQNTVQHLVLVVDDTQNELRLYLNGSVTALGGFSQSLSSLNDVNNWLGRSNYKDPPFQGSIDEFRIYKTALTAAQIEASYAFGPNPDFL